MLTSPDIHDGIAGAGIDLEGGVEAIDGDGQILARVGDQSGQHVDAAFDSPLIAFSISTQASSYSLI